MKIKLWNIYKVSTNALADKWDEQALKKHHIHDEDKLNKPKTRYTIPIELLGRTADGEDIFLALQTNETLPKRNAILARLAIPIKSYIENNKQNIKGFILPINERVALESEFDNDENKDLTDTAYIDHNKRDALMKLKEAPLEYSGRKEMVNLVKAGALSKAKKEALQQFIEVDQFNLHELSQKTKVDFEALDLSKEVLNTPMYKTKMDYYSKHPSKAKKGSLYDVQNTPDFEPED